MIEPRGDWQIGYVPRDVAAMLAPKMDKGTVKIEGAWLTDIDPGVGAEMLVRLRPQKLPKVKKPLRKAK